MCTKAELFITMPEKFRNIAGCRHNRCAKGKRRMSIKRLYRPVRVFIARKGSSRSWVPRKKKDGRERSRWKIEVGGKGIRRCWTSLFRRALRSVLSLSFFLRSSFCLSSLYVTLLLVNHLRKTLNTRDIFPSWCSSTLRPEIGGLHLSSRKRSYAIRDTRNRGNKRKLKMGFLVGLRE